jgi:hypothetical protein
MDLAFLNLRINHHVYGVWVSYTHSMPQRLVDTTTVNVIKNGLVGRANAAPNTCRWRNVVTQERVKVLHKKYIEVVEQELTTL